MFFKTIIKNRNQSVTQCHIQNLATFLRGRSGKINTFFFVNDISKRVALKIIIFLIVTLKVDDGIGRLT